MFTNKNQTFYRQRNTLFGIVQQCISTISNTIDELCNESATMSNPQLPLLPTTHYSEIGLTMSDSYIIDIRDIDYK